MKSIPLTILTLLTLLASGCEKTNGDTYCDLTSPILFGSNEVVNYLIERDNDLVRGIVLHNETHGKMC